MEHLEFSSGPRPLGPYSSAVRVGGLIFFSGILPVEPESGKLISEPLSEATERILRNLKMMLLEMGLTPAHVVKTTIYTTKLEEFGNINDAYRRFFEENGGLFPARTTVGVASLPMGATLEMDFIVSAI